MPTRQGHIPSRISYAAQKNTNIGIAVGILIQVSSLVFVHFGMMRPDLQRPFAMVGTLFIIWGCMNYAEGKGASKWCGLLGFLSILGIVALYFLPDQHKDGA